MTFKSTTGEVKLANLEADAEDTGRFHYTSVNESTN